MRRTRSIVDRMLKWAVAVALFGAASHLAYAAPDDEESPVFGQREKPPVFHFDRITGYFSLVTRASNDQSSSTNSPEIKNRELTFEESFTLHTTGYIIHPNLVDLNLTGQFGLTQDRLETTDGTTRQNDTLYTWDANATILRNSSAPLTLYSMQSRTLVNRTFGATLEDTTTSYGAIWQIRSNKLPSEFRLYHTEQTQSPLASNEQTYNLNRNGFEWHTEYRPSDWQHVDWNYNYETVHQTSNTGVTEDSVGQGASLSHTVQFGKDHRSSLDSTLSWSDVTGLFPQEISRWTENLKLQHTPNFETNYQLVAEKQNIDGQEQERERAAAGFRHQLYESLTTVGRIGAQNINLADESESKDYFANIDFSYHKKAPLGLFIGTLAFGFDQQDNSGNSDVLPIRNTPFVFTSFAPVTIQQQNIVPSSVALRDLSGQVFFPGDGYTVTPVPGGMQLQLIPGGPIDVNQPLLLNYNIAGTPENTVTTDSFSYSLRYEFQKGPLRGVSPYYRFSMANQDVSGGQGQVLPNNFRRHVWGVDYRLGDLTLRAQQERVYSDLYPYNTDLLEARYDHRFDAASTVSLAATYTNTEYPDQHNTVESTLLTGVYTRQFSRELSGSISASYLHMEDNISGTTNGTEQQLEIDWTHRQTTIYTRLRNSILNTDTEDRMFQYLEIGIRRDF